MRSEFAQKKFCNFIFVLLNNEHNSLHTKTKYKNNFCLFRLLPVRLAESNLLAQAYNRLGQRRNSRQTERVLSVGSVSEWGLLSVDWQECNSAPKEERQSYLVLFIFSNGKNK